MAIPLIVPIGAGAIALIIALSSKKSAAAERVEPGEPHEPPPLPPHRVPPEEGPPEGPPEEGPSELPPGLEDREAPPGVPPSRIPYAEGPAPYVAEVPPLLERPPEPPTGEPPIPVDTPPMPSELNPPAGYESVTPPPPLSTPAGVRLVRSPFKAVPPLNWSKFVRVIAKGESGTITKGARYGLFLFGVKRLADLGMVKNVKRGTYRGTTVWTGTWIPPYSESAFLTSIRLQYRAFVRSNQLYASKYAAARAQYPALFKIGPASLTLSGFLAFAHLVGFMGVINSLKSKSIKPDTLAFVLKANNLF